MNLKPHVPLAVGVLVIVLTQLLCTWRIVAAIDDNTATMQQIDTDLDDLRGNLDALGGGTRPSGFEQQEQSERAFINGPGFTIKDGKQVASPPSATK